MSPVTCPALQPILFIDSATDPSHSAFVEPGIIVLILLANGELAKKMSLGLSYSKSRR